MYQRTESFIFTKDHLPKVTSCLVTAILMSNRIYPVGVSTPGMDSATFPRGAEAEWSTLALSVDTRIHPTSVELH